MKLASYNLLQICARLLLTCVALAMLTFSAWAQETRSTILGTVKDSAGSVVAGANIEVVNTDTNITARLMSNDKGYFEAPYLLPGNYTITVVITGFKKYVVEHAALDSVPVAVYLLSYSSAKEAATLECS